MAKNAHSSNGSKSASLPVVGKERPGQLSRVYEDYRSTDSGRSWFDTKSRQTIPAWQFDQMFRSREAVAA